MKKRTYLFLFMSVLMTVFIFRNSAKTSVESGEASGKVLELVMFFFPFAGKLADADTITHIIRKTAHFAEFFCQGLFFCGTFLFDRKKNVEKVVCFVLRTFDRVCRRAFAAFCAGQVGRGCRYMDRLCGYVACGGGILCGVGTGL